MNAACLQAYTIPGIDAMQAAITPLLPLAPLQLAPVGAKAVALDFDGGRLSSDAGLVRRKDPDAQLGLTHHLAAVLSDPRDPRRVHLPHHDLLTQRVCPIAAGYEDANDANTLRHDPICTLRRERLPATGAPLAAPPTLSRCENRVSRTDLSRMALVLVEQFLASYVSPPTRIGLDVDDTEAPVHGGQEQARDDGYDGGSCFLPLPLYEGLSGRLIPTIFKAKRCTGAPWLAVLTRLGKRLRQAWPHPRLIVRGDSPFASPEVMQWIEEPPDLSSVTGLPSNHVLPALAREVVAQTKRASERDGGKITRFHAIRSQAGTWARSRRVVIQVEGADQGVHTRFVVTDLEPARPKVLSQHMYCARGQADNDIKEHKRSLQSARTSCQRFAAQQCRLFGHAAASVFLDTLRREVCKTTPWASATMATMQLRLLTVGARVPAGTDRITIALPSSCPVALV
jgi:hypothetical protein